MPQLLFRKVSGLFTLLLITSTSFVVTFIIIGAATVNHLYRIVAAEDGLATSRLETAGVTHSRRGRRYYSSPPWLAGILTATAGLLI